MTILGIDSATKTGWCLLNSKTGEVIESGVEDFTKRRGESNGMLFMKFRHWLNSLVNMQALPKMIVYEQAHHRGGAATELCTNLTGRIQEVSAVYGIEYTSVRTTTLKLWFAGKGNAGKDLMINHAKIVLGREPIDDNEADAVALACYGFSHYFKGTK